MVNFGMLGAAAVLGIAAVGSAIGLGFAGSGAIGAWKKCYMNNKQAPGALIVFAGAPLTQTIYGFLVMQRLVQAAGDKDPWFLLGIGIIDGIGIAISAIAQGKAGACAADSLAETGQGFGNYITVVGLCETVALFVMAFAMMALG